MKESFSNTGFVKRRNADSLPNDNQSSHTEIKKRVKTNPKRKLEVYCRFRPIGKKDKKSDYFELLNEFSDLNNSNNDGIIQLNCPDHLIRQNARVEKYTFKRVFDENCPQEPIFQEVVYPLISDAINNKNGVVFTYGVTNAGKTHTIIGDMHSSEKKGILPRVMEILLTIKNRVTPENCLASPTPVGAQKFDNFDFENLIKQKVKNLALPLNFDSFGNDSSQPECLKKIIEIELGLSAYEIYNEDCFDLLNTGNLNKYAANGDLLRNKLKLRECADKKVIIEDLNDIEIKLVDQAMNQIEKA